jgi:hypothetical protein
MIKLNASNTVQNSDSTRVSSNNDHIFPTLRAINVISTRKRKINKYIT